MKAFLVAPSQTGDSLTKVTNQWARDLHPSLNQYMETVSFLDQHATMNNLKPALDADLNNPGLFIFINHGNKSLLAGSDGQPLIHPGNIKLLKNKFIYSIACKSAAVLGHEAILQGAAGFLGFNHYVYINLQRPDIVRTCLLSGLKHLVVGNACAATARKNMVRFTNLKIQNLKSQQDFFEREHLIFHLRHNCDYSVLLGDPWWRIPKK